MFVEGCIASIKNETNIREERKRERRKEKRERSENIPGSE
jgi:hypothetical protein